MSWSVNYTTQAGDGSEFPTESQNETVESQNPGSKRAFWDACRSVDHIVNAGSLGDRNKVFLVTLNGHHNPDEKPVFGWSNDYVTINIQQQGPVPNPAKDAYDAAQVAMNAAKEVP